MSCMLEVLGNVRKNIGASSKQKKKKKIGEQKPNKKYIR